MSCSRLEIGEKRENMNIEEMVFDLIPEDARDIFRKRAPLLDLLSP